MMFKQIKLAERRHRNELIGKIEANYAKMNKVSMIPVSSALIARLSALQKDPPIGLAAASTNSLVRHLEHVRSKVAPHFQMEAPCNDLFAFYISFPMPSAGITRMHSLGTLN